MYGGRSANAFSLFSPGRPVERCDGSLDNGVEEVDRERNDLKNRKNEPLPAEQQLVKVGQNVSVRCVEIEVQTRFRCFHPDGRSKWATVA